MENGDEFRQLNEDHRLDSLDERLDQATKVENQRTGADLPGADSNYNAGNRVLAELLGGMIGGGLLGWLVDRIFNSWPWGFLVLLSLGIIVAFRNIIRLSNKISRESRGKQQ